MTEFSVRGAVAEDGAAIAAVQQATWRATYAEWIPDVVAGLDLDRTAANWAQAAARPGERVAVAVGPDGLVGYAWSTRGEEPEDADRGELAALYVLPQGQGRGAGTALVADALAWVRRPAGASVWCGPWSCTHRPGDSTRRPASACSRGSRGRGGD